MGRRFRNRSGLDVSVDRAAGAWLLDSIGVATVLDLVRLVAAPAVCLLCLVAMTSPVAGARPAQDPGAMLATAQRRFYDGRYVEAADLALALRAAEPGSLASYELRTAALLFQIKRLIGDAKDKDKAYKACEECPALVSLLLVDFKEGQAAARAALATRPGDLAIRFFLGKLNLNYVWLQLGPLGRRTGWNEYWEARRSMDAVLVKDPNHVRARVARAWIEYIVDTRTPWGFGWVLGGGSKKRALDSLRAAAAADSPFFDKTEANFALWEMQVRERDFPAAVASARRLAADFPENRELIRFLTEHKAK
jgi:hypothetical protein